VLGDFFLPEGIRIRIWKHDNSFLNRHVLFVLIAEQPKILYQELLEPSNHAATRIRNYDLSHPFFGTRRVLTEEVELYLKPLLDL